MEEQYGEHYAQKVEERLLHYLQGLESALPGDTYIDKVCVFIITLPFEKRVKSGSYHWR